MIVRKESLLMDNRELGWIQVPKFMEKKRLEDEKHLYVMDQRLEVLSEGDDHLLDNLQIVSFVNSQYMDRNSKDYENLKNKSCGVGRIVRDKKKKMIPKKWLLIGTIVIVVSVAGMEISKSIRASSEKFETKVARVADEVDERLDSLVGSILDTIAMSGRQQLHSCKKSIISHDNFNTEYKGWYYDFSLLDKDSMIYSALCNYQDFTDVDVLYNSLSEEDKKAIALAVCYPSVIEYDNTNNKDTLVRYIAGNDSSLGHELVYKKALEDANVAGYKLATYLVAGKLGVSLDTEQEMVSDAKGRGTK